MSRSVREDRDAAIVGAGLDVLFRREDGWNMGLKLGYGADLSKNANDQNVFVGFEIKF